MPAPSSLHLDPGLTNFATAYTNTQFIADEVCPPMPVSYLSASFKKGARVDVSTIVAEADYAGNLGAVTEIDNNFTQDSYTLQARALMEWSGEEEMAANSPLSPEENAVMNIMQRIKLSHERRVAVALMNPGNFAATIAAAALWTNTTTSTPIANILAAKQLMPSNGDDSIVVAACSDVCFDALRQHPSLLALKGVSEGLLSVEEVQRYLGIDKIWVSKLSFQTANEGQAAAYSRVWDSSRFGLYTIPRTIVSTRASMFACSFRRGGFDVMKWFDPARGSRGATGVKVSHDTHAAKILQSDMGVLITAVT